jgi:metal-responsive CopG/Arc/MetJ family transcriptional regulator
MANKGGRGHRAVDPRRNAGVSLTQAEIDQLDEFKTKAGLDNRSAVVQMLIKKSLPQLWWDLQLKKH